MKLSSQIFTLFGFTLLLVSPIRTVLAAGGDDSSSGKDAGACDQIAPLPIFIANGREASYGTFIDAIGTEKEATYANLAEEYFELLDSVPDSSSWIDVPQDFADFYLLTSSRESAGEGEDKVIYVPEGKYTMFALGRLRSWTITVNGPPPVDQLPPREELDEFLADNGQTNFVKYYIGTASTNYEVDQAYDGTYDPTDPVNEVLYTTEHNVYASELSFYLEKKAKATVDGCKIPDAITYLTKSKTYPPRSTDLSDDPEDPATLKTATGWFMLLPPLTPGLHFIESMTYNAQFHPPDSLLPAGFEKESARTFNVCVGDPSGCNVGEGGSKKGSKDTGGKRTLKRTSSSKKNGPRGIRAGVKTPEQRRKLTVKGLVSVETGYDY